MSGIRSAGRVAAFAAQVGLSWVLALGLAGGARLVTTERFPTTSAAALLLVAMTPGLARAAERAGIKRAHAAAAIASALLAPLLALIAFEATREALIEAGMRCIPDFRPVLVVFVAGIAGFVAGLLALAARRAVDRRLRVGAWIAFGAASALTLASVVRAARYPDVDVYLASLPTMTVAPDEAPRAFPTSARQSPLYSIRCRALESRESCGLAVAVDGADPRLLEDVESGPLVVRRDDAYGITILERASRRSQAVIYDAPGDGRSGVRVEDIADRAAPPVGWIVGAALGLSIAVALRWRRARLDARRSIVARGADGVLGADGWITFPDGVEPIRASDPELERGDVLVIEGSAGDGYRRVAANAREVVIGSRAEALARADAELAGNDALALAALVLAAAPLGAAWLAHLVP